MWIEFAVILLVSFEKNIPPILLQFVFMPLKIYNSALLKLIFGQLHLDKLKWTLKSLETFIVFFIEGFP